MRTRDWRNVDSAKYPPRPTLLHVTSASIWRSLSNQTYTWSFTMADALPNGTAVVAADVEMKEEAAAEVFCLFMSM